MASIRADTDSRVLMCEPVDADADPAPIEALEGVAGVTRDRAIWRVELAEGADGTAMLAAVAQAHPFLRVEVDRPTLETVFVRMVKGRAS